MKKWIPAGLAVLLVVALTINLTLYFDQQRLSQDMNALKTQRVLNGQERSRIATVGAEQRIDLVSTIGQQKGELERIQRLLQVQQASVQGLSQAISNETQPGTVPAAASTSLGQYQTDLEGVRKDLSDLRGAVDKLKDYAFKLEKSLNLPAPDLNTPGPLSPDAVVTPGASPTANTTSVAADTATLMLTASQAANTASPGSTSTPKPFSNRAANDESNSSISNGSSSGNINLASYSIQLSAISQNINLLGSELQGLLQRYEKLEAAAASNKVARSNDSLNVPGIDAVLSNAQAQKLATLSYAPQGWPVRGPVTSPFGPRSTIFGPAPKTTASSQPVLTSRAFAENKGGNNLNVAPANTTTPDPISPGGVSMANVSPSVPVNTATPTPSLSPSPTIDTSKITPIVAPNASPSLTVSPTATITPTATVAATPSLTPTAKATVSATATPNLSPGVSPSPGVSVSPGPTASGPSVAIGISGGISEVGPGMEFHTGIDIGVNEGSEVRATAAGVIEAAGDSGGYGKAVFIQHPGGFMTVYGHNSRLLVVAGQSVKAGEVIALSGNTGYSTGPHVHYEVRYQNRVMDPTPFMK